jgi:hypothetical protein
MKQIYLICQQLESRGVQRGEIVVDATAGKKPMSAGAMIAAATLGLSNVYVEVQRNEDGVILPETMRAYELPDPREVLTEYYGDVGIERLNQCEFASAKLVFERLHAETSNLVRKKLWESLMCLSEAFDAIDKFDHNKAATKLDTAIKSLGEYQTESHVLPCDQILGELESFQIEVKKFSQPDMTIHKVLDIFANAQRRLSLGRYDDAVARLYRTLEALAHLALQSDHGYDGNRIKEEELTLEKSYVKLLDCGHVLGWKYNEEKKKFRGMLESRNYSILAHGWRPIGKETAQNFSVFVESYLREYCRSKNVDFEKALKERVFPKLPTIRTLLYGQYIAV